MPTGAQAWQLAARPASVTIALLPRAPSPIDVSPTACELPWSDIDTVLLDLDGTLLDLHYDNYFFGDYLPTHLATLRGVPVDQVRAEFAARCRAVEGTLAWYCLDHWERELGIELAPLKRAVADRVNWRRHAPAFLDDLAAAGKRRVLATNAHPGSLAIKAERIAFGDHLEASHSAHELGAPKEHGRFWSNLQRREDFDPTRTLFVDDNPRVLAAARDWGIRHVLGITRPDSRRPPNRLVGFRAVEDFDQLRRPRGAAAAEPRADES